MNKNDQQDILKRLACARGHLGAVEKMVETGEYCVPLLHQTAAVMAALRKINGLILENHLKTCVADGFKSGKQTSEKKLVTELMDLYQKLQISELGEK